MNRLLWRSFTFVDLSLLTFSEPDAHCAHINNHASPWCFVFTCLTSPAQDGSDDGVIRESSYFHMLCINLFD